MARGHDYEHEVANELYEHSSPSVFVARCGYSGNSAIPQPDIVVASTDQDRIHGIEVKKRSPRQNQDGSYTPVDVLDEDDFEQLRKLKTIGLYVWVGIKFTHRQMYVFYPLDLESVPDCFDARMVNGKLKMRKPRSGAWPSTREGKSDHEVISNALGLPTCPVVTND